MESRTQESFYGIAKIIEMSNEITIEELAEIKSELAKFNDEQGLRLTQYAEMVPIISEKEFEQLNDSQKNDLLERNNQQQKAYKHLYEEFVFRTLPDPIKKIFLTVLMQDNAQEKFSEKELLAKEELDIKKKLHAATRQSWIDALPENPTSLQDIHVKISILSDLFKEYSNWGLEGKNFGRFSLVKEYAREKYDSVTGFFDEKLKIDQEAQIEINKIDEEIEKLMQEKTNSSSPEEQENIKEQIKTKRAESSNINRTAGNKVKNLKANIDITTALEFFEQKINEVYLNGKQASQTSPNLPPPVTRKKVSRTQSFKLFFSKPDKKKHKMEEPLLDVDKATDEKGIGFFSKTKNKLLRRKSSSSINNNIRETGLSNYKPNN